MKPATLVILIVVIIAALIFGLSRSGIIGGGSAPSDVMEMPTMVIDVETLELVEVPMGDFEQNYSTDPDTGYKIDPDGRKLARPITCVSCGEKIPPVPLPEGIDADSEQEARDSYTCPECGNNAYMP